MPVPMPKKFTSVGEDIIAYAEDFHGMKINFRKIYSKDGETFLGKGLCLKKEDWEDLKENWDELVEYIDGELK